MNKRTFYFLLSYSIFVLTLLFASQHIASTEIFTAKPAVAQPASVFFVESSTPETLKQVFAAARTGGRKLRVLIVPGHDNEYWGTEFQGVKEADMTLALGTELDRLLLQDPEIDPVITRNISGYTPTFASYFSDNADQILLFVQTKKQIMTNLISQGQVSEDANKIYHNDALAPVVERLYGINKWANEHNIDLVIHIHFNDYPRRKMSKAGEYSGFSIYVPDHQYSNARASKEVADSVSKQLQTYYPESNLPIEDSGVVEDQDLIAVGAFNTVDPAVFLVEYGYIYEPQFLDPAIRGQVINELAMQTYIGLHNFFENATSTAVGKYGTTLLPYTWKTIVQPGVKYNSSILSLQAALVLEGVYPPANQDKHDCPLSGTYGPCTEKSLALFQQKYNIGDTPGKLGVATRQKLNELYGE